MFSRDDLVKFAPDYLCTKEMKIDLRGVIGRIDGVTAKGYFVYFRVDGKHYKYEFPSFALIGVTDNVANRSRVASQTSVELTKEGLFMKFDDGTWYDFKGERYRPIDLVFAKQGTSSIGHSKCWFPDKCTDGMYILRMDLDKVFAKMPESESKPESKMTKDRCIKLLESYRAEREKVAKGRKFERCLRDEVVNEALERAIELLKV